MPEDATIPRMYMYTSGNRLSFEEFSAADVDIMDIAHNLSVLPRFAGNTARPYSVAEHSLMVMQMVEQTGAGPDVMLQALLHDATEAYMGDVPAPVKFMVPEIRDFEQRILWPAVAEKFGLAIGFDPRVKTADWTAFYVEASALCHADDLSEWENYDKYMPLAEKWIEAFEAPPDNEMPHPSMIMQVFVDTFRTLTAVIENGGDIT